MNPRVASPLTKINSQLLLAMKHGDRTVNNNPRCQFGTDELPRYLARCQFGTNELPRYLARCQFSTDELPRYLARCQFGTGQLPRR